MGLVTLAYQQESSTPVTYQLIKRSTTDHGNARLFLADIGRKPALSAPSVKAGEAGEAYTLVDQTVDGAAWRHPSFLADIGRK